MRFASCSTCHLLCPVALLLLWPGSTIRVVHAQSLFDIIFPCGAAKGCTDPCQPCDGAGCDTASTKVRTGLFGWQVCPGCPRFAKCWAPPPIEPVEPPSDEPVCCHLTNLPSAVECGNSGCTCCNDGKWIVGDSGPTRTAKVVCGGVGLQPGVECQYYGCTKDLMSCPDDSAVGRDFTKPDCSFYPCPGE
jgi:hypothetical protein